MQAALTRDIVRAGDLRFSPVGGNGRWPVDRDELIAAHCFFGVDQVAGRPDVTDFKRHARWHQAQWRIAQDLPIGSHASGNTVRPNGSRIPVGIATQTGANFLSDEIRAAVERRLSQPEKGQTLDETRLRSDLLSSMPMCFNLFGEATGEDRLARAVDALWPDHPGQASALRFEWSPGRGDYEYLNNRTAFDAAVLLDLGDGSQGVIGIETKYHEDIKREKAPDAERRLPRYCEVTERSGLFRTGWEIQLIGTDLQQIWLDHLLVLAMLQHPSGRWTWGRFVLVHPATNPSVRDAALRYRGLLSDQQTFEVRTVEDLLDHDVLHTEVTAPGFRERYLWRVASPQSSGLS